MSYLIVPQLFNTVLSSIRLTLPQEIQNLPFLILSSHLTPIQPQSCTLNAVFAIPAVVSCYLILNFLPARFILWSAHTPFSILAPRHSPVSIDICSDSFLDTFYSSTSALALLSAWVNASLVSFLGFSSSSSV